MIGPVKEIEARLSRIAAGDFSQRVHVINRDELGALGGRRQPDVRGARAPLSAAQSFSKNKSQFLSNMSHELRTPLNAIIGLTEMMVANAAQFGTEKAQEPLKRVNNAGTHLLGLINQVLDLSKIEAGKLELNPATVSLAPLIDEVIGTARQLAEQNKNRLVVEAPDDLGALTVGSDAAAANPPQPAEQRLQVHQAGRGQAAGAKACRRRRLGRACRGR